MRTLRAIAMLAGGIGVGGIGDVLAQSSTADAARKRIVKRQHYAPPRQSQEAIECERARYFDPTGLYAGYPCWAREAFGKANRGAPE